MITLLFFAVCTIVVGLLVAFSKEECPTITDGKYFGKKRYFRCYCDGRYIDSVMVKARNRHFSLAESYFKEKHKDEQIYIL
jgi:hypothetical protein